MEKTIIHCDLNGFYASVECFCNPSIRDKPVIVGGDAELRHGIVLAKNDLAKKFGIITGETVWQAKAKCPGLVSVKPDYEKYLKFSRLAKAIFERFTPQCESFGIDESWLDCTGSVGLFGDGKTIADKIRFTIRKEMGITASAGVSFNKIFAKLGSDMKKPDATTVISRDNFQSTVWKLPASDLLYVGRSTTRKLNSLGVNTIGQLANTDIRVLLSHLGKWGAVLYRFANGLDDAPVSPKGEDAIIKSVGNSTTLPRDVTTREDVRKVFYMLSESVASRLREHGLKASAVQIYVRDSDLISCERQAGLRYPSCISGELAEKAMEIYVKKYFYSKPIRSLGIRGCNLTSAKAAVQLDLFSDQIRRERMERFEESVDVLRKRFGHFCVQRGLLYEDRRLTGSNPKDHVIHPVNFFDGAVTTADYNFR